MTIGFPLDLMWKVIEIDWSNLLIIWILFKLNESNLFRSYMVIYSEINRSNI